jgi:DNA-binding response OmpR family regulator
MSQNEDAVVLIVEDEKDLARTYQKVLETTYTVRVATSGEEGLEIADNEVDVVLLDRRMPGMSGDEMLANLVERGITAKVAMLTAVEPDRDIVDMPFDDYITKPVDHNGLLALVDVLLKRATYDERSQEFFRLAAKKATLETAGEEDSAEYDQITDRLSQLQQEVDATLDQMSTEDAFINIDPTKEIEN